MARLYDYQKSKVYAAERVAERRMAVAGIELRNLTDIHELRLWVQDFTFSTWFRRRWGHHNIEVADGRGCVNARGGYNKLTMPRWARAGLVPLHELAHAAKWNRRTWNEAPHGRDFCKRFIEMVKRVYGQEAAVILKKAFRDGKVKTSGRDEVYYTRTGRKRTERKRTMKVDPEVLRKRLEKARQVRRQNAIDRILALSYKTIGIGWERVIEKYTQYQDLGKSDQFPFWLKAQGFFGRSRDKLVRWVEQEHRSQYEARTK